MNRTSTAFLSFVLAFVSCLALTTTAPSCRSIDAITVPKEVVTTVLLRSDALSRAEVALTAGQLNDAALVQALADDEAAWKFLRKETDTITASADMKAVLQTQEVGVRVAGAKIAAGEYQPEDKLALLRTLRDAWKSLETYYNPKVP